MNDAKVVLYGASGFTGKRAALNLAKKGIFFIAAGRNKERLTEQMSRIDGLKTTDYSVVQVDHEVNALTDLLKGKTVVFNLVGPYMQLGEPVVKAALEAGCHYLDATGEQDWMLFLKEAYSEKYAQKELVLSAANSAMWNSGMITSELCLAQPDIDSLDIVYTLSGVPSVASTLSFMRMCCQPQYYLENNELVAWEPASHVTVNVPGVHGQLIALPWSGGGEAIWYKDDKRVRNCRTLVTFTNQALMGLVIQRMQEFRDKYQHASAQEQEIITNKWAMEIAPQGEPMDEDPAIHRCLNTCNSRGTLNIHSLALPVLGGYALTAGMGGIVVETLLQNAHKEVGFTSATQLVGAKTFYNKLKAEEVIGEAKHII